MLLHTINLNENFTISSRLSFKINNANVMSKGLILDENNTAEMTKVMDTNIIALCIGSLICLVVVDVVVMMKILKLRST